MSAKIAALRAWVKEQVALGTLPATNRDKYERVADSMNELLEMVRKTQDATPIGLIAAGLTLQTTTSDYAETKNDTNR